MQKISQRTQGKPAGYHFLFNLPHNLSFSYSTHKYCENILNITNKYLSTVFNKDIDHFCVRHLSITTYANFFLPNLKLSKVGNFFPPTGTMWFCIVNKPPFLYIRTFSPTSQLHNHLLVPCYISFYPLLPTPQPQGKTRVTRTII